MTRLADMVQLRKFTSGRAAFAARQVAALAKTGGEADLEAEALSVIDSTQTALSQRREWAKGVSAATGARAGGKAVELDNRVDRLVSAIYNNAHSFVRSMDDDAPEVSQAKELIAELFPRGVADITGLAFEDEAAAVDLLLKDLRSRFAPHAQALGLTPLVQRLSEMNSAFNDALAQTQPARVSHDQVTAAEAATQERLAALSVSIMAEHRGDEPEVIARRTALLAPILDQDERIADALRRHRPVNDVDPETGEEIEDPPQG